MIEWLIGAGAAALALFVGLFWGRNRGRVEGEASVYSAAAKGNAAVERQRVETDHDIAQADDLAARARAAGLVRKPDASGP